MLGRALLVGEASGALQDQLDAELLPGKLLGFFDRRDLDLLTVDFERIALCVDRPRKAAVHRVVLEQVRQRLGVGDVVDADKLDLGLFRHRGGAQHVAPDAPEPVDPYPNRHDSPLS